MLWVAFGQDLTNAFLRIAISQCDWRRVGLALDFDFGAIVGKDFFCCFLAKIGDEFFEFSFLGAGKFGHDQCC